MPDYEQEPQFQAPLLVQLWKYLTGQPQSPWSATDYAMGLSSGPLKAGRGFKKLMQSGSQGTEGPQSLGTMATVKRLPSGGAISEGGKGAARELFDLEAQLVKSGKITESDIPRFRRDFARRLDAELGDLSAIEKQAEHENQYRLFLRALTSVPGEQGYGKIMQSGPKTPSGPGSLSGLSEADRPWTEIYDIAQTGGKKVSPRSYQNPTTVELPAESTGLGDLMQELGGTMTKKSQPARFLGRQEMPGGQGFDLYNLVDDIVDPTTGAVLHPRGSTVSKNTLQRYGVPFVGSD